MWGELETVENAFAKVNLTLDILGKMPNGYHEMESVMQQISLHDIVKVKEKASGISIKCSNPSIPTDEKNLCWKAVELMQKESGLKKGAEIEIQKNIPMAGGLAGGSTDAASVLKALNKLWKLDFSDKKLSELGEKIGMDVCFCLKGNTCFATGRGEKLEQINFDKKIFYVLCNPSVEVPSAWAYKHLDNEQIGKEFASRKMKELLEKSYGIEEISLALHNDFEFTIPKHFPIIGKVKAKMKEFGAMNSIMSGSGSTVIGIAKSPEEAESIREKMAKEFSKSFTAETLI